MLSHHCQEIRTSPPTPSLESSLVPRKPAKACRGLNKGAKGESIRCRYCTRPRHFEDALHGAPAMHILCLQYFPCITIPVHRRKLSQLPEQPRKHFGLGQVKLRWFLLSLPSWPRWLCLQLEQSVLRLLRGRWYPGKCRSYFIPAARGTDFKGSASDQYHVSDCLTSLGPAGTRSGSSKSHITR